MKEPLIIVQQDHVFERAVSLGCEPTRTGVRWRCQCTGGFHGISEATPVLTETSLDLARHKLLVIAEDL